MEVMHSADKMCTLPYGIMTSAASGDKQTLRLFYSLADKFSIETKFLSSLLGANFIAHITNISFTHFRLKHFTFLSLNFHCCCYFYN